MAEQPQGTEYTLQGVMRFLQIEWHNHERARNAWDIERAEMKAKIAKQEGECRSARKLNESLDRQIRMLERALKYERAKNKAAAAGQPLPTEEEVKREWNGRIGIKSDLKTGKIKAEGPYTEGNADIKQDQSHEVLLNSELDSRQRLEVEKDAQRDKSKQFLQKCVEELTYLLTPPTRPVPPHVDPYALQNSAYNVPPDMRPTMEELYQPRRAAQTGISQLPTLPNHHAPPPPRNAPEYSESALSTKSQSQAALANRQAASQQPFPQNMPLASSEDILQRFSSSQPLVDEQIDRLPESIDAFGMSAANRENDVDLSRSLMTDDPDAWNFDEPGSLVAGQSEDRRDQRAETELSANHGVSAKSPPRVIHRRKSSGSGASGVTRRRSDGSHETRDLSSSSKGEPANFKVRFALRGHLDVVRSVIFTGGGSPSEPEICTTGDDGMVKRWIIPATYGNFSGNQQASQDSDLDVQSYFTHRGHEGMVTCLASCPASPSFSTGGRALGDGWIFSGGQDATIRVWERGRVDPKATLEGHTDAVWALCVLPATSGMVLGQDTNTHNGGGDRILLASGSADHTVKVWAVSAPPQLSSPQNAPSGSRRGVGGSRRHSITSGSGFPSSPQPSTASGTPFHHTLVHSIEWPRGAASSPTCITPMGPLGENFVVSYLDSSILIFDTRTGEEVVGMASSETYDGTPATGINAVVVTSSHVGGGSTHELGATAMNDSGRPMTEDEAVPHGATGSSKSGGIEGVVISGHEDRYVRFFDANSGQGTYSMLAHPSSIASLSLSPDGRELVSAGHDASLRFWSLEKRSCIQEITSHRLLRGEGVVSVVWSQDGRWVVSGGGDGVVKVFSR